MRTILFTLSAIAAAALAYLVYDGKIVAMVAAFRLIGILP